MRWIAKSLILFGLDIAQLKKDGNISTFSSIDSDILKRYENIVHTI